MLPMLRVLATTFAALAGLAFGSFLNVCLTRWPQGENIAAPRSHCRTCARMLTWWENIPLLSWLALRGRCRTCRAWIGWRYPFVELAVCGLWAIVTWRFLALAIEPDVPAISPFLHWNLYNELGWSAAQLIFFWLLVAISILDVENLWIPDWLTLPGVALGVIANVTYQIVGNEYSDGPIVPSFSVFAESAAQAIANTLAAALLILLIRWLYKLIRHREGIGLGDAKLMAMLGAWLGLPGALLSLFLGVTLGSVAALIVFALPASRKSEEGWAFTKLPLGTFLCIGGIVSALWGQPIIAAYLHWAGL